MTLRIRSVKEAKEGRGVFYTFNTVLKPGRRMRGRDPSKKEHSQHPPANIPRPIISRDMYLSFDFIELLGEEVLQWNSTFLWGCWISQVPGRIGRNAALDDAAECFIAGHMVIYSGGSNERAKAIANAKYTTALGSLQKALYADDEVRYSTETLAAVNLLLLYDVSKHHCMVLVLNPCTVLAVAVLSIFSKSSLVVGKSGGTCRMTCGRI